MGIGNHVNVTFDRQRDTWTVVVAYPDPLTGERRRTKRRGHRTKSAALEVGHRVLADLVDGFVPAAGGMTVGEGWARLEADWKRRVAVGTLARNTLDLYRDAWRLYLAPLWSERRLSDISADHVRTLFDLHRETGKAAGTLRAPWHVGRNVFAKAVVDGLVRANPFTMAGKRADVIGRADITAVASDLVWNGGEVGAFRSRLAADPHRFGDVWLLMLATGMRRGEALAVRDESVDLGARTVTVDRQWTTTRQREPFFGPPKTRSSNRTIALNDLAVEAIRSARRKRNEAHMAAPHGWVDTGSVFAGLGDDQRRSTGPQSISTPADLAAGHLPHPSNVSRQFTAFIEQHGLKVIPMHGLRHTFATSSLEAGVPIEVISRILGHSSIEITSKVYVHATPELHADSMELLDSYYRGHRTPLVGQLDDTAQSLPEGDLTIAGS